ncbi:hypothetical protein RIF29_07032 [Crotalaria pallida]|uniref:Uncharacterized protein n=1 Tax=Crotalaria pallida TaxID=3830 RepID=A0AAN9J4M4_CROPI
MIKILLLFLRIFVPSIFRSILALFLLREHMYATESSVILLTIFTDSLSLAIVCMHDMVMKYDEWSGVSGV